MHQPLLEEEDQVLDLEGGPPGKAASFSPVNSDSTAQVRHAARMDDGHMHARVVICLHKIKAGPDPPCTTRRAPHM